MWHIENISILSITTKRCVPRWTNVILGKPHVVIWWLYRISLICLVCCDWQNCAQQSPLGLPWGLSYPKFDQLREFLKISLCLLAIASCIESFSSFIPKSGKNWVCKYSSDWISVMVPLVVATRKVAGISPSTLKITSLIHKAQGASLQVHILLISLIPQ